MDVMNDLHLKKELTHDEDDPPPVETAEDRYWYVMNRWAEWCMGVARTFGFI